MVAVYGTCPSPSCLRNVDAFVFLSKLETEPQASVKGADDLTTLTFLTFLFLSFQVSEIQVLSDPRWLANWPLLSWMLCTRLDNAFLTMVGVADSKWARTRPRIALLSWAYLHAPLSSRYTIIHGHGCPEQN